MFNFVVGAYAENLLFQKWKSILKLKKNDLRMFRYYFIWSVNIVVLKLDIFRLCSKPGSLILLS